MADDLQAVPLADLVVNDGTRPSAPAFNVVREGQRDAGRHLAAIHRHYLMDMARIMAVLRRIEAGDAPTEELHQIVLAADMSQNLRAFGNLCGQECQVLTMHHNIEQQAIFPQLESTGNAGLRAVVKRLREEHKIVHELLERLASAAHKLISEPTEDGFAQARAIFVQLEAQVRSHFRYEETELADALGVFGVRI